MAEMRASRRVICQAGQTGDSGKTTHCQTVREIGFPGHRKPQNHPEKDPAPRLRLTQLDKENKRIQAVQAKQQGATPTRLSRIGQESQANIRRSTEPLQEVGTDPGAFQAGMRETGVRSPMPLIFALDLHLLVQDACDGPFL